MMADMAWQQQIALVAAVGALIFVVFNMRRRRPLDGSPKQYRREIDAATTRSGAVKRDMEQLLVELEELSRKINAQIDTKFAKLEQSIADADKRVSALRILIDEAKRVDAGNASSPAQPSTDPSDEPETTPQHGAPPQPTQARHDRIYELADRGMTPVEIARQLDQKVGEVELILNLRNSAGGPGTA